MKTLNLSIWAVLLLAFLLSGCKKDLPFEAETVHESAGSKQFVKYAWSPNEALFFSLEAGLSNVQNQAIQGRSGASVSVVYHPAIIELYNTIARQNAQLNFIEEVVENVGIPVWRYARVIEDQGTQETLVILPLVDSRAGQTNALVTSLKTSGELVLNAHTRQHLLEIESDDAEQKAAFLTALAYYDSFLFNDKEGEAQQALCDYKDSNPDSTPNHSPPVSPDCEWNILVICSDLNTQTSWFGGVSNIPPHLDHDGDGIINSEDPDFERLGISQEQFDNWFREWWQHNQHDQLGDYDQYFQNSGNQSWRDDYDEVLQFWDDIWDDMWQDFEDSWMDQHWWDEWYDDYNKADGDWWNWGDDRDRWDDGPIVYCDNPLGPLLDERTVRCFSYYVLDCGVEEFDLDNWWHEFDDYVPCSQCPDYDDFFVDRTTNYYEAHEQAFSYVFSSYDELAQMAETLGCEAASPSFEQCLNEAAVAFTFGLGYEDMFSDAALSWLINRPVYPEGPDRISAIARYVELQGGTPEAVEHALNVTNWIASIEGFSPSINELNWLLEEGFEFLKTLQNSEDISDADFAWCLENLDKIPPLFGGLTQNHFDSDDLSEIIEKMIQIDDKIEQEATVPREEYINQINAIKEYLRLRHSAYGEASQYLEELLPHLIQTEEFTNAEVSAVYDIAYSWYSECVYRTLSEVIAEVIRAVRPFIELALLDGTIKIGFQLNDITVTASRWLVNYLPPSVAASSAQVWNRISSSASFRPNTEIPETFTLSSGNGLSYYVQYSGSKHLGEIVTKNGIASQPWYNTQKGLRSQIVLDDFARAIDDITSRPFPGGLGPAPQVKYYSNGWEIIFGEPTSSIGNGLPRIFHAVRIGN